MKSFILALGFFALILSATAEERPQIQLGQQVLSCTNKMDDLTKDRYSVSVFSDNIGYGFMLVTKNEEVVFTSNVNTSGNGDTFAVASAKGILLTVDAEDGYAGRLRFENRGNHYNVYFEEMECSNLPSEWPYPGIE